MAATVSTQSVLVIPDYIGVNVVRNTSGKGTAVLAAPLASEYYVIDLLQIENLSQNVVNIIIKSDDRVVWQYRALAETGLIIDKPLTCDKGKAIFVDLDVSGSDVRTQMLVVKVAG